VRRQCEDAEDHRDRRTDRKAGGSYHRSQLARRLKHVNSIRERRRISALSSAGKLLVASMVSASKRIGTTRRGLDR